MKYKIEKGIPIPQDNVIGRRTGFSATLRQMEPGESVLVPGKKTYQLAGSIFQELKGMGRIYIKRQVEGGVRVWRVE